MRKKKIAKIITFFVLSIALVTAHIKCVNDLYDDYVNKVYNMGYTKYNLSSYDLENLIAFDIYIPEMLNNRYCHGFLYENQYNKDKDKFELMCGENTEDTIKMFNEILIEVGGDVAERYGFSESNPITSEWILTHPEKVNDLIYSNNYVHDHFMRYLVDSTDYLEKKMMFFL